MGPARRGTNRARPCRIISIGRVSTMNGVTSMVAIWTVNGVLAVGLLVAAYTDLRDGKIYNKLTFPCILLGFLLNTLFGGLSGSWQSECGVGASAAVAVALAVCLGPAFGGGDLKL